MRPHAALLLLLATAPCLADEPLDRNVLSPGLVLMKEHGPAQLRQEAARADAWSTGAGTVSLEHSPWALRRPDGTLLPLSPRFGSALRHMNSYFGLTAATLSHPITDEELSAALLSAGGVASVTALFEKTMDDAIRIDGRPHLSEIGGEMTLDGTAVFHMVQDPTRPALRMLLARRDDPEALRRLLAEQPVQMSRIDKMGILKRSLDKREEWDATDRPTMEVRTSLLRMAVDNVAQSAADHYSGDTDTQLEMMIADDWSGRFAGPWHLHPPDPGPNGWLDSTPPSDADYEAAAKHGQEIVLVFLNDGFDAYELSSAAAGARWGDDLKPFASHRSPQWRAKFQELYDRLTGRDSARP